MSIKRACSYQATIKTPKAPSTYSEILVTFQQDGANLIQKTLADLETDETYVTVNLTQEETALFTASLPAYLQIRCYAEEYDAPGSKVLPLDVYPALDDQILGGE
ncbi:MAG: hypothetical protein IKS55_02620 [Oscillospiraceae bacterium]|nr:hypothetical protein [Oscillospiraceae bacterium]